MEVKGELKLKVEHLTLSFGSLQALMDVSFEVYGDEILALIGPVKVVDAVRPTPVLGAGGIADGRALAAASTLGAEGIWVGTAFVATQEANVDAIEEGCVHVNAFWDHVWKQKLLNAVDEDTTVSKIVTGKTARYLKNKLIDQGQIRCFLSSYAITRITCNGFVRWNCAKREK